MFSQHSVLSPPLLAAIDSQHTFGSYDATGTSNLPQRASVDASSTSPDDFTTSSHPRGTRLRASSATSFPNSASSSSSATSNSVNQNGHVNSNKKSRRSQQSHSAHSRSGSRPGPLPISGRVPTTHVCSSSSAPYDQRTLTSSLRNRSTPHLDGLQNGTARQEHSRASGAVSAMTAPSSPLASASASLALAMSPIAQASAMWDHLMPTDWTLDSSAPASPHSSLSRIPSDYFDPAILAQLRSQSGSSHPELRSSDRRPDPSPPVDMVFDRLSPHQSHAIARRVNPNGPNVRPRYSRRPICSDFIASLRVEARLTCLTSIHRTSATSLNHLHRMHRAHQCMRPNSRGPPLSIQALLGIARMGWTFLLTLHLHRRYMAPVTRHYHRLYLFH